LAFDLQKILFVSFYGASLVLILFSVVLPGYILKLILVIIAMLCDILAFSSRFYWYFFIPFLHKKGGMAVLRSNEPYLLSPSGNTIIVREGGTIYASAFIKIPIYKSTTEMSNDEKVDFARMFSRVITLSKSPIRISSQMYIVSKEDYIEKIRDRLNQAEDKYQNINSNTNATQGEISRIKGEVTMWHNLLDNVSRSQSYSLLSFAMITAAGGTDEEASNLALQQADEIIAGINATFGVTASIAENSEILLLIEPEQTIPYSTVSEQIRAKTAAEGL
jgi:hypothetical protein